MSVADNAFAVILGGGGGTRLWPSSRRARPKQLLSLGRPESLLGRRRPARRGVRRPRAHAGRHRRRPGRRPCARRCPSCRRRTSSPSRWRATRRRASAWARSWPRGAGPTPSSRCCPADPYIARRGRPSTRLVRARHRRSARDHRHHRRPPDPPRDRLRLHPPRRAAAARRRRRARRRRLRREARSPDGRALPGLGRLPLELGHVLPDAPAACCEEARRHLPGLGALLDAARRAPTTREPRSSPPATPPRRRSHRPRHHGEGRAACACVPGDVRLERRRQLGGRCRRPRPPTPRGNVVVGGATPDRRRRQHRRRRGRARPSSVCWASAIWSWSRPRDAVLVIPKDRAQDVRQLVDARQEGRPRRPAVRSSGR